MSKLLHCFLRRAALCMLVFTAAACGIENVVYLERPQRRYGTSYLNDLSKRYCEFTTAGAWNTGNAAGYFQGTEIYYRIYERESDCSSDIAAISRYNDDNPANSATYLQDTKKYYRLTTADTAKRPLMSATSSNIVVRFRLQNYGGTDDPALVTVNGASLGVPYRGIELPIDKRGFINENIGVSDIDVQKSSSTNNSTEFWYVNFYAVSYGYDKAFRTLYSALEPLGYIKMERNS